MNAPTRDVILQRLERLERANYRWQIVGSVALAVLGLVVLLGATGGKLPKVTDEIQSRRFTLVDQYGKTWAMLHFSEGGLPRLDLIDKDAKIRVGLGLAPNGWAGLGLSDKDGKPRGGLGMVADGTGGLMLLDKDEQDRVI